MLSVTYLILAASRTALTVSSTLVSVSRVVVSMSGTLVSVSGTVLSVSKIALPVPGTGVLETCLEVYLPQTWQVGWCEATRQLINTSAH